MISSPAHLTSARRRYRTRVAVAATAAACLGAVVSAAAGAPDKHPGRVVRTITVYAFQEGSLIPVAGTNPDVLAQGDEEVVNDQLTATHAGKSGFPIIGHDAGSLHLYPGHRAARGPGELRRHRRAAGREPDRPGHRDHRRGRVPAQRPRDHRRDRRLPGRPGHRPRR